MMMMMMIMIMMIMMMMIRTNSTLILQILLLLLVHFSPQSDKTLHVFLAFLGILVFCLLIPLDLLWLCTLPGIVLGLGAAMFRVASNYQRGHTGQMSLITAAMNAAGLVVRTFTTLVENGQSLVAVTSVILALALNSIILAQVTSTSAPPLKLSSSSPPS